jgi:hypothetical protein
MKQVTINVSEPVYRIFQEYARSQDRTASEIIREAMELYRVEKIEKKNSIQDLYPVSVGKILQQAEGREDYLDEMIYESGY